MELHKQDMILSNLTNSTGNLNKKCQILNIRILTKNIVYASLSFYFFDRNQSWGQQSSTTRLNLWDVLGYLRNTFCWLHLTIHKADLLFCMGWWKLILSFSCTDSLEFICYYFVSFDWKVRKCFSKKFFNIFFIWKKEKYKKILKSTTNLFIKKNFYAL